MDVFLIKRDCVLLTHRFRDDRWQASCSEAGSEIRDAQRLLYEQLGIHERLVDCGGGVYRAVTVQEISTTPDIDNIEWVRIEDLPSFVKNRECDDGLEPALTVFLSSIGSSISF